MAVHGLGGHQLATRGAVVSKYVFFFFGFGIWRMGIQLDIRIV